MPALSATSTTTPSIKLLYMGYSGEGKSTSIVPLSIPKYRDNEAFNLKWLDFDGKAEEVIRSTLARLLFNEQITKEQHDEALANNDVALCTEKTTIVNIVENKKTVKTIGAEGKTTAWNTAVKQLDKWQSGLNDRSVLVVDSFTYAVRAIAAHSQELNNKLNKRLEWRDFMGPQQTAEDLMVLCADFPCNVIVCAHQDPLELYKDTGRKDEKGEPIEELLDTLMVPISVGRSGRMKLPARFNHLLMVSTEGSNDAARRYIYTIPHKGIITKTPYFGRCKERYPMETGLVDYFKLKAS